MPPNRRETRSTSRLRCKQTAGAVCSGQCVHRADGNGFPSARSASPPRAPPAGPTGNFSEPCQWASKKSHSRASKMAHSGLALAEGAQRPERCNGVGVPASGHRTAAGGWPGPTGNCRARIRTPAADRDASTRRLSWQVHPVPRTRTRAPDVSASGSGSAGRVRLDPHLRDSRQGVGHGRIRRVRDEADVLIVTPGASRSVSRRHSPAGPRHRRGSVCGQENSSRRRAFRRWTSTGGDRPEAALRQRPAANPSRFRPPRPPA